MRRHRKEHRKQGPETETATEQKDEQEAEAAPSVEDRLAETNDQLLRALAELKTRGGAPIATGPRPSNTGPRALPATCWGLPIIYSVPQRRGRAGSGHSARCRKIPARRCCRDRTRPDCKHGPPQGQPVSPMGENLTRISTKPCSLHRAPANPPARLSRLLRPAI